MKKAAVYFLLSYTISLYIVAQSKDDLVLQKQRVQEDIEITNKLLEQTKQGKEESINTLLVINKRVDLRNQLVQNLVNEIGGLENNIREKEEIVSYLKNDLIKIKTEYENIICAIYKYKINQSLVYYLFSSQSFNSAYKRIKYYKNYSEYRKEQVRLIHAIESTLASNLLELEEERELKNKLLLDREKELFNLEKEKENKQSTIKSLMQEERDLKKKLQKSLEIANKLENEIRRIIELEAKKSNSFLALTPQDKITSANFSDNKGRFPWPTEHGVITSKFGVNNHPALKGVKVPNNGIDIATIKNSDVRVIFEGVVTYIAPILGANYAVIVKHGSFFSVYQNIENIYVKVGQKVSIKDPIGKIYSNPDNGDSILHLELWNGLEKMNPEDWLSRF